MITIRLKGITQQEQVDISRSVNKILHDLQQVERKLDEEQFDKDAETTELRQQRQLLIFYIDETKDYRDWLVDQLRINQNSWNVDQTRKDVEKRIREQFQGYISKFQHHLNEQ